MTCLPGRGWPLALLAALVVGCGPGGSLDAAPSTTPAPAPTTTPAPGTAVGIPDPDTIDPARLDPLEGMPACPDQPRPSAGGDAQGLPLPVDATVATSSTDGPLQSVQGTASRTPVEIMVEYLRRPGIEVVAAEDEVFESEVLLLDGDVRVFVKSQATCARGSAFVLFASTDPALVPVPAGTGP